MTPASVRNQPRRVVEDLKQEEYSYGDLVQTALALGRLAAKESAPNMHVGILLPDPCPRLRPHRLPASPGDAQLRGRPRRHADGVHGGAQPHHPHLAHLRRAGEAWRQACGATETAPVLPLLGTGKIDYGSLKQWAKAA